MALAMVFGNINVAILTDPNLTVRGGVCLINTQKINSVVSRDWKLVRKLLLEAIRMGIIHQDGLAVKTHLTKWLQATRQPRQVMKQRTHSSGHQSSQVVRVGLPPEDYVSLR